MATGAADGSEKKNHKYTRYQYDNTTIPHRDEPAADIILCTHLSEYHMHTELQSRVCGMQHDDGAHRNGEYTTDTRGL